MELADDAPIVFGEPGKPVRRKVLASGPPEMIFAAYQEARSRFRRQIGGGATKKVDGFHCLLSVKDKMVGILVVEAVPIEES